MRKKFFFNLLLLVLAGVQCLAQAKPIAGTVTNETGEPLSNATVTIRKTSVSTKTNAQGKFFLEVPAGATTLVVTYVGMDSAVVPLTNAGVYTIQLKPLAASLSDVIVVGYGTVKKSDLTGSVQRISREDLIRDNPGNILQAMQGKLAGVNVTQNDGAPGAGLSIRIRGSNSFLGGTEPLYVIDGVPFNNSSSGSTPSALGEDEKQSLNALAFLNPADIESIDVLKDASATAIYGSRGANGVVLITTRKGKVGRDKVEVLANVGVAEVTKTLNMLSPLEYAKFQNLSYANARKYDGATFNDPYPDLSELENDHTDWQNSIFRKGFQQQYTANISGANENGNHSISFNYIDQEGIIQNSGYRKMGLNLNLNRNLGKIFRIGTSTAVSNGITRGVKTGTDKSDAASAGVIRSALTYPTTISTIEEYDGTGEGYFITNPVIYTKDVLNKVNALNIFSSNFLEINLSKDLKFRQNLGFNYGGNTRDQYYPRTVYEGFSARGWGLKSDNLWTSIVTESIINYAKSFGEHSLNFMGAATYEKTAGQWKRAEAKDFPNDQLENENFKAAALIMPVTNSRYSSALVSFLGRVNYSLHDKYLLTASIRRDGSSKFGKTNKWANFPSAALAWKVHREDFMKDVKWINELGLRASFGQTGNQGIGAYSSLAKLAVYNYPFDGTQYTGLADDIYAGPANDSLIWETTTAWNLGLDLGLLEGRINFHVDAYYKKTKDLLQYVTTPPSTSFERQLRNSGSVENKGIELALDARVISNKQFEWKASANIAFNRNKILELGSGLKEQYAGNISTGDAPFIQRVGSPIGALYGYVEDGYFDNEAEVRNSPLYTGNDNSIIRRMIGEVKYLNLDKDPSSIGTTDRTFIGDVNPDYIFGITNNFRYQQFDLSIFVNGVQGNDVINMNTRFNDNFGTGKNVTEEMLNGAWAEGKDNSNATGPKAMRQFWRNMLFTRRFIEDGSFVRIKNVTLGYNFPQDLIRNIRNIRIAFGVNNLFTFTDYSGFDPEVNSYGDNPAMFGVDLGGYPNSRTYSLSLRCSF